MYHSTCLTFLTFCPLQTRSSDEVLHILSNILGALQRGRTSLVIPKKKPIDELMKSRNMVSKYLNTSLVMNLPKILIILSMIHLEITRTESAR